MENATIRSWQVEHDLRKGFLDPPGSDTDGSEGMHRLRGLIIGQAAEVEDALGTIVLERRRRLSACGHGGGSSLEGLVGDPAGTVRTVFCELGLCEEYARQLDLAAWALEVRDFLLDHRLVLGFTHDEGLFGTISDHVFTFSPVISGRQERGWPPYPLGEPDEPWEKALREGDCTEAAYAEVFDRVQAALDAAVDLWQAFDRALSQTPTHHLF